MEIPDGSVRSAGPGGHGGRPGEVIAERFASGHRFFPAGAEVYAQGEPAHHLCVVTRGWVYQHRILMDGRRQILDFCLPGTLFGFQPDPDAEMTHTAESLTGAAVALIPSRRLRDLFDREPDAAMRIASAAAGALESAHDSLTDLGRRTAREALAHLMLRLFFRARAASPGRIADTVALPLSQTHIADAIGRTPVHVCRILRGLREYRVMALSNGRLTVFDLDRLIDVAGGPSRPIASSRRATAA